MSRDLDAAKRWRDFEAEAREVANQLTDPASRRTMLIIAEGYKRLAEHAEKRDGPEDPQ